MALAVLTVTDSISKLTVTGVTLKDIDEIPTVVDGRMCPIIYPEPVDFVTNFDAQKATLGEGAGSQWDVNYDLKYTLCFSAIGSGRGMELFSGTISTAFAFMDAIMVCNPQAGAVLIRPGGIGTPGPVSDPSGNQFFGVSLTVHVLEFVG